MATTAKSAKDSKESIVDSTSIPVMPSIADRPHAVSTAKELGFVSALVFDGSKDHDGKQFNSNVWLAIPTDPKSKSVGSIYLGVIAEGRWQPIETWQAIDSDLAAMLFPSSGQHGPEQQKLAAALDRAIRRIARTDFDDARNLSREASRSAREAMGKARLELVKSMID